MKSLLDQLQAYGLVPVVVLENSDDALPLAQALQKGGLPCAEVTFRTEAAKDAIRIMTSHFPHMLVGAGTVLTTEQVDSAKNAGAKFIVSPGLNPKIVRYCQECQIPVLPGCSTPSDMEQALELGLTAVKFFPAQQSGGLSYIKAVAAPYTGLRFMPTGGISDKNLKDYLSCPHVLACGGSWMVNPSLIKSGQFEEIEALTRQAVSLVQEVRSGKSASSQPSKPLPPAQNSIESALQPSQSEKPFDLLALGEILLRLSPSPDERLSNSAFFQKSLGGAELNVAAGCSLLGLQTGILSKLPDNALGEYARNQIKLCGVSTRYLSKDSSKDARLGVYYYEYGSSPRKPLVVYDRLHTSARKLRLDDFPENLFASTRCFHTSGITLALDENMRKLSVELIRRFKEHGALISFDVNYRSNLWSGEEAKRSIEEILPYVDIFFCSEDTARLTFQKQGDPKSILKSFTEEYPISVAAATKRVVHSPKLHSFSSILYHAGTDTFYQEEPYENIEVVDRIGSGDAFVAGVLYGLLSHSFDCQYAQHIGNAASVLKNTVPGDLPSSNLSEVEQTVELHHSSSQSLEMIR